MSRTSIAFIDISEQNEIEKLISIIFRKFIKNILPNEQLRMIKPGKTMSFYVMFCKDDDPSGNKLAKNQKYIALDQFTPAGKRSLVIKKFTFPEGINQQQVIKYIAERLNQLLMILNPEKLPHTIVLKTGDFTKNGFHIIISNEPTYGIYSHSWLITGTKIRRNNTPGKNPVGPAFDSITNFELVVISVEADYVDIEIVYAEDSADLVGTVMTIPIKYMTLNYFEIISVPEGD